MPPPHPDHEYAVLPRSLENQLYEARKTICEQGVLIKELQQKQFMVQNLQGDDKQISFYTGFPDNATFKAVFLALQPTAENMVGWSQAQRLKQANFEVIRQGFSASELSTMDQFFIFLCRLRQGFPEQDLATRFHISQSTVSRICVTWVNFLYYMLGTLPIWPTRKTMDELMPDCFKCMFPGTRVISDCTEIPVQKPSSKVLNAVTYSHYKGNTTFKGLIGIAPSKSLLSVTCIQVPYLTKRLQNNQVYFLCLKKEIWSWLTKAFSSRTFSLKYRSPL